ncbi:hypothetical protein SAMN05660297_03420 [Natronincola peptidivorans]|uniref:Uncharacterized protein n=1 Tax=Natronincola peptidivorans TaxID=426128 RepID=A0A1I0GY11_9FIRM|nr:hypothetical protein SAMN05660297_03420 [Natronincola peptidivorans]
MKIHDCHITSRIAEAFELDPKGMLLGGACLPAKRFGSERSGAGNALLYEVIIQSFYNSLKKCSRSFGATFFHVSNNPIKGKLKTTNASPINSRNTTNTSIANAIEYIV